MTLIESIWSPPVSAARRTSRAGENETARGRRRCCRSRKSAATASRGTRGVSLMYGAAGFAPGSDRRASDSPRSRRCILLCPVRHNLRLGVEGTMATYRADHVGSFLRPPALLDARRARVNGDLDEDALRRAEDAAVQLVLALQKDV